MSRPLKGIRAKGKLKGLTGTTKYAKPETGKPRRNAGRAAPVRFAIDELEYRAIGSPISEGSVLERILAKRLTILWGKLGIDFDHLVEIGGGYNAVDFVVYRRPSGRELVIEPQGAHWHGPKDRAWDFTRALYVIATGRDYEEIWEWEMRMGDEYLDAILIRMLGGVNATRLPGKGENKEIKHYRADLEAGLYGRV